MQLLRYMALTEARAFGGKAYGLKRLSRVPVNVPETFVVAHNENVDAIDFNSQIFLKGRLAVRSSAAGEDGAKASFAGQHLSLLDVERDDLKDAVIKCRASGSNSNEYADAMGQAHQAGKVNVLIQPMINADYAGVAFTADPDTRDRNVAVIEYVAGTGDKLMSGEMNPLQTLKVKPYSDFEAPQEVSKFIAQLFKVKPALEKAYRCPVDVEWAIQGEIAYWLQARSITGGKWTYIPKGLGITSQEVEGYVHVIEENAFHPVIGSGEILVTRMTSPGMVGAMLKAGGIITEIGGTLCHAAVVSRELGKPCIVSYPDTAKLKTGQRVRMIPAEGRVEVLDEN